MTLPSGIPIDELDPGIRPQDDLLRHVNGRWLARSAIPADRARDSAFRILADQAENAVRAVRTCPSTPFLAPVWEPEGSSEQQPTMPLRECRAGRSARDHPLTLNQARRGLGSPTEGIEARPPVPDSLAVQRSVHDLASLQYQRMSAQACPPSGTIRSSGSSTPHSEHWAGCDRWGWSLRCRAIGAPRAYEMWVHRNSATSSGALRANRIIMAIGSELL
jgi:hypothetical protein